MFLLSNDKNSTLKKQINWSFLVLLLPLQNSVLAKDISCGASETHMLLNYKLKKEKRCIIRKHHQIKEKGRLNRKLHSLIKFVQLWKSVSILLWIMKAQILIQYL